MEKIKKTLLMIATGLVGCTAIMVAATNNSSILETSIAGLSKGNTNDRTLTLNSSTPLNIDNGVGTLTVGNIGIKAKNCVQLDNGIATIEGMSEVYIYCTTAGLDGNNYNYGFNGSTISSITFVVNNHNGSAGNLNIGWIHLDSDLNMVKNSMDQSTPLGLIQTSENQTKSPLSTDNFIKGQDNTTKNCICFYHSKSSGHLDLISIIITYSCK